MARPSIIFGVLALLIAWLIFAFARGSVAVNPAILPCKTDSECVATKKCSTAANTTRMCVNEDLQPAMLLMVSGNTDGITDCAIYHASTVVPQQCILQAVQTITSSFNNLKNDIATLTPTLSPDDLASMTKLLVVPGTGGAPSTIGIPGDADSTQLYNNLISAYAQILPLNQFSNYVLISDGFSVFSAVQTTFIKLMNEFTTWAAHFISILPSPSTTESDQVMDTLTSMQTNFTIAAARIATMANQSEIVIQYAD